jgi:hypothetical protein
MEIVNFYNCRDQREAREKEQEYFVSLNATLNSIEPFPKPKIKNIVIKKEIVKNEFYCVKCNINCKSANLLELHNATKKHKNHSDCIENTTTKKFVCMTCDYECSKNSDFIKHEMSRKHTANVAGDIKLAKEFKCERCEKIYNSRNGLWKHNKTCIQEPIVEKEKTEPTDENIVIEEKTEKTEKEQNDIKILTNLVLEVVKNNTEMQKQMMELYKQGNGGTHINNSHNKTINSNNKTFNLQFFLNEQCKDAMNIMDFVNTFQLQLSDLERIGEVGYVEGISNIVIDKLNQMDIYKRPIHCSDAKRETMHVKDNDGWTKDSPTNDKIRLALKHITKKNTDLIRHWINAHPGVLNSEHRLNDKYQELFIEAMGGKKNKNMKEGEDKIIKKICKMVLIDKNNF